MERQGGHRPSEHCRGRAAALSGQCRAVTPDPREVRVRPVDTHPRPREVVRRPTHGEVRVEGRKSRSPVL